MSFNQEDSVVDIIDNLIECIGICINNKQLWKEDKTRMIMFLAQEKPEFYARRGRLVHSIVMYNDVKMLSDMLRKLYLAQQGVVNFKDVSDQMVMHINTTHAPEATKEITDTIKQNMNK
jgi:hypothetical protein